MHKSLKISLILTPEKMIFWSVVLLAAYYTMPIMINITLKIRYAYFLFAVALWIIGILMTRNAKLFASFLFFELFILTYWISAWSYQVTFFNYIMPATAFSIFSTTGVYYFTYEDTEYERKLLIFILLINFITAICTIVGVIQYPYAVRNSTRADLSYSIRWLWRSLNIGNWNYLFGLVFLVPSLVFLLRKGKHKALCAAGTIVSLYCIFVSQLTTAMIIAVVLLIFSVFDKPNTRKNLFELFIGISLIILLIIFLDKIVLFVGNFASDNGYQDVSRKMETIHILLAYDSATGNAGDRLELSRTSFNTFLRSPLFGLLFSSDSAIGKIGFHSEFFDVMGALGIIGLLYTIFYYGNKLKNIYLCVHEKLQWQNWIIILGVLVLSFLNPILYASPIALNGFLVPALITRIIENNDNNRILE